MSKRKRTAEPRAFYTNYTGIGTTRDEILVNDVVNILIHQRMKIWSKKEFVVKKIYDAMNVFLYNENQEFKMERGKYYYFNDRIYKALYGAKLFWTVEDIETGDQMFFREILLKNSKTKSSKKIIFPVFRVSTFKLRLSRRLRITERGMRMFKLKKTLQELKL